MKRNEVCVLAVIALLSVIAAVLVVPGIGVYTAILVLMIVTSWNVHAYYSNRFMLALWAGAAMPSGVESERRKFTFWLTLATFTIFVGGTVFQNHRWL